MNLSIIRAKLTDEELSYLKATRGNRGAGRAGKKARKQLGFVEREMMASCTFCKRSTASVG
jgi:hypothetical protein